LADRINKLESMQSAKGHTKSTIQTKREAEIRELKAKREELKRKKSKSRKIREK